MADRNGVDYLKRYKWRVHGIPSREPSMYTRSHTFECPLISPVDEPVSNMKAWPNLHRTNSPSSLVNQDRGETHLSRPSPTAIIRLLSPSHSRSFLHRNHSSDTPINTTDSHSTLRTHIAPERTLYSPFKLWSSPTMSQTRTDFGFRQRRNDHVVTSVPVPVISADAQ